ncbi:MAG: hypothetical protein QNJ68_10550 [Microcoleaceae cyanobacterium MO_207.B10]|nr:hypothetical protein [Microcoleaceae cyanobacterium MO_207.B10]
MENTTIYLPPNVGWVSKIVGCVRRLKFRLDDERDLAIRRHALF